VGCAAWAFTNSIPNGFSLSSTKPTLVILLGLIFMALDLLKIAVQRALVVNLVCESNEQLSKSRQSFLNAALCAASQELSFVLS
jgi:hypothetical protein